MGARAALLGLIAALAGTAVLAPMANHAQAPAVARDADPLRSPGWRWMATRYFSGAPIEFDARVQVKLPTSAEDALNVPVQVDARALAQPVTEILVFADLNPITTVLRYRPIHAHPALSFRFKVQQGTPVRAAARTADGVWHIGGAWIDAAGGGCTAPSIASGDAQWSDRLGEISARLWPRTDHRRLRFQIMHPMDTGLADGIPAFYIERAQVMDEHGQTLAELELFEPVAENPVITLDLPGNGAVELRARDTQGNPFVAEIAP
ncbi:quinoprotein dehydrogenase-associated SoxYZ-like carrier [Sinimarinibacterium sp. NLF-5-8]|uniref:quinoprotein dehydrogenase-associated SoxYZ-like carrier n=1 Tax=Sinimarinibacterium sp. NLF-5-8 TaxID=2698684 RepID=UPI001EE417DC|nr:quinoprotein dehydrogenase-associated SoxYZ-like carrier [Sinimarinibacterium sp. NLF-5-8]